MPGRFGVSRFGDVAATLRGYVGEADLLAIGGLIRRSWNATPRFNAWTFARFDIWAQRRIADEALDGVVAWHDDIALWLDGRELVAAAFGGEGPGDGVLVLGPAQLQLAPGLLAWLEERHAANGTSVPLVVEVNRSNGALEQLVAGLGYDVGDAHFLPRLKHLGPEHEIVRPAEGFRIETLRDEDIPRYNDAVHAVFSRGGTDDAFRYVLRAPSFVAELGLIAVDANGTVISFSNAWADRALGVAEFEPVGTRATHQRLGLASALMRETENRLRRLGIRVATVHSWSQAKGANRLYDRLGYRPVDRQRNWRRTT